MAYSLREPIMGLPDLSTVSTAGSLGAPWVSETSGGTSEALPSVTMAAQLGMIADGWDLTNGYGKFIYLAVPVSTAVTIGLLYQWDKNYAVTVVPVGGTSKNTGVPVACAINTVASNASSVQYTWFQIQGAAVVLKTAVTVSPQSPVYIASTTAGRVKVLSSAGQTILGARTQNTATVTSTTSSVLVYLNFSALEGA